MSSEVSDRLDLGGYQARKKRQQKQAVNNNNWRASRRTSITDPDMIFKEIVAARKTWQTLTELVAIIITAAITTVLERPLCPQANGFQGFV